MAEKTRRNDGPVAEVIRKCRKALIVAFLITVVADVLALAPIIYMLNVYDRVLMSRSAPTLVSLTLIVVGIYVFWSTLEWVRSRLLVRLSLRLDWDISMNAFDAAFRAQMTSRGVNVHRVLNDVLTLRQFITGQPILSLMTAPFAIVYAIIGAIFHIYLAIFAIVAVLLMLLATWSTQRVSSPALRKANDASADATRLAAFNLRHAETAYALGMHSGLRDRWYDRHRAFLELQVNASESTGLLGGIAGLLGRSLPSLQIGLGAWLAIEGLITGGMVIAASLLIARAVGPIRTVLSNWPSIVNARQAYEQLTTLLNDDRVQVGQMKLPEPVGRLVVNQAAARPPGAAKTVLSGIHFTVEPGSSVAVVGPSAAGKTTLAKLLVGIWAPALGSVRLDGVEVSAWNHDELGPQIGYVPQEIDFFEGTVAENIARLRKIDADKVVAAAKLIGAHDMILTFPKGYDTHLGERGYQVSAGQAQRIAIARAFYNLPKFIVLDEPNSNLDDAGEQALADALHALKQKGCTVIVTTHRPKLITNVDFLLVLHAGAQQRYDSRQALMAQAKQAAGASPAVASHG